MAVCLPFTSPRPGRAYVFGPPVAQTGGFGEPTCHRCHADHSLNDGAGRLEVEGAPASFDPGNTYRLTVVLARPRMGRAGFQMAARFAAGPRRGEQAGTLSAADGRAEVFVGPEGVQYAQHTEEGVALSDTEVARWLLEWKAPRDRVGEVIFHLAANAANYDDSEFGDFVYTRTWVSPAAPSTR